MAPAVEAFRRTDVRKKRCLEDIKKVWGEEWKAKAEAAATIIPHDSERTLGLIRRISRRVTADVFVVALVQAVDERLKNWGNGRRIGNQGTLTDLVRVQAKLATVPPPRPEPKKSKLIGAPKTPTDSSTDTSSNTTSDAESDTETHIDSYSLPKKKTKSTKGEGNMEQPVSAAKTTKKAAQITAVFATCECKNKKEPKNKVEIAKKSRVKDQKLLVRSIE